MSMNVAITAKQTHFTYLVESDEKGTAEKVIELGELSALAERFASGDMTLTDEEQCLALIFENFPQIDVGAAANTNELCM